MGYLTGSATYAARQASATPTITLGVAVSVGDIIVVYYGHDTSTSDTVPTDNLSNTYTFQGSPLTDANFNIHRVATTRVGTAGTPTITLHLPGTPSAGAIAVTVLTGRAVASFVNDFDQAEQAAPNGVDQVTCPALTTSAADDVVYFLVGVQGNLSVFSGGTGFTERLESGGTAGVDFDVSITDQLNVGGGSLTPVGTTNDANRTCSFAIAVKSAGGGGGGEVISPFFFRRSRASAA